MPAKIINGRRYDTERAKEIGYDESNFDRSNFHWYEETLYQKKTGEFFIHGNGHAASPYSTSYGYSSRGPGEELVPLTIDEAKKWVEEHLSVEVYEDLFGEIDEDDEAIAVCIKLTPKARDMAKRVAAERGTTMSALIEGLIINIKDAPKVGDTVRCYSVYAMDGDPHAKPIFETSDTVEWKAYMYDNSTPQLTEEDRAECRFTGKNGKRYFYYVANSIVR